MSSTTPSHILNQEEYHRLVNLAKAYFNAGLYEQVSQYLEENRYHLNWWAAYLLTKYGSPHPELESTCIEVLESNAASPG
ncbi:hypothetical protein [Pedobacter sp. SYSU D00535]|uniref:hypothetical protein n=1 Tax=Pedobacter sp. SYSU D00535 TaxID=2810308 RepID=UPI001A96E823|nr:hypothetical protein [Pedobacter sp. SYSU D00535]